jgi:hypothetical protein
MALYPQPNVPGAGLSNNYFAQGPGSTKNDKFDWRLDGTKAPTTDSLRVCRTGFARTIGLRAFSVMGPTKANQR